MAQEWRLYIVCPTFCVSLLVSVSHSRSLGVTSHLNYSRVHMRMRKNVHTLARARAHTHRVNGVIWKHRRCLRGGKGESSLVDEKFSVVAIYIYVHLKMSIKERLLSKKFYYFFF